MSFVDSNTELFETRGKALFLAVDQSAGEAALQSNSSFGQLIAVDVSQAEAVISVSSGLLLAAATDKSYGEAVIGEQINLNDLAAIDRSYGFAFLSLAGENPVFLEDLIATDTSFGQATLGTAFELNLTAIDKSFGGASLQTRGNLVLEAEDVSFATANLVTFSRAAERQLRLTIRILPETKTRFDKDDYLFTVNGEEIELSSYTINAPENSSGFTLAATLKFFSDRERIAAGGNFQFELKKLVGGTQLTRTFITAGNLTNQNLQLGFANGQPTDSFAINALDSTAKKLEKVPLRDLLIYDGIRIPIKEDQYKVLTDTEGREYHTEFLNIPGLKLYDLFEEIFIKRCGFAAYETNLPNYAIRRADFSPSATFYDGLKGFLGVFDAEIYETNGTLHITDVSNLLPEGFPEPRVIDTFRYQTVQFAAERSNVDSFKVAYTVDDSVWDYFRLEIETLPSEIQGQLFDDDYSKTDIRTKRMKYFKNDEPNVAVRDDLIEEKRTTMTTFDVIGETTEKFEYDSFGRIKKIVKETKKLVPNYAFGGSLDLTITEEVVTEHTYGPHPFEKGLEALIKSVETTRALVAIDTENEYRNAPFKQVLSEAHRAGNLSDETGVVQTEFIPVRRRTEKIELSKNGQSRVRVRDEDLLNNLVQFDYTDVRSGDFATNVRAGTSKEVLVFKDEAGVPSGKLRADYALGEVPLIYGIPLIRRKMKQAENFAGGTVDMAMTGLELFLERGEIYKAVDRGDGTLGRFLVKSFAISGSNLRTEAQVHQISIRGKKI